MWLLGLSDYSFAKLLETLWMHLHENASLALPSLKVLNINTELKNTRPVFFRQCYKWICIQISFRIQRFNSFMAGRWCSDLFTKFFRHLIFKVTFDTSVLHLNKYQRLSVNMFLTLKAKKGKRARSTMQALACLSLTFGVIRTWQRSNLSTAANLQPWLLP